MYFQLTDLKLIKPLSYNKQRLLGVDLGDKTIGFSLSDTTWTIASPYESYKKISDQVTIFKFQKLIKEFEIAAIIMGYPLHMNGDESQQSQKVIRFSEKLLKQCDRPILLWDERWSTMAVTRSLIEADLSRKKQKKVVDKMAASFILQGVLDALGH